MYISSIAQLVWRYGPLLALVGLMTGGSIALATEEPAFELLAQRDKVEVRRYPPTLQAITEMPGGDGANGGFRRLAGFIFGGNSTGESIAMTAPVQRNLSGDVRHMTFYMPGEYDRESLPAPQDPSVSIREVPSQTVAVLRFSGRATNQRVGEERQALEAFLQAEGIDWRGEWLLNQYNPPWTPPFMRRNEIWVEVDWPVSPE